MPPRRYRLGHRTRALTVLLAAVVCGADHTELPAQSVEDLRAVLRARNESVHSLRADITVVSKPGAQRAELAAAQLRLADWVDRNKPELNTTGVRESIARTSAAGSVTTRKYRYTSDNGKIRIEELPASEGDLEMSAVRRVRLYNGSEWKAYSEGNDPRSGETSSGLVIRQREPSQSWFEIARGAGVLLSAGMSLGAHPFELDKRAHDVAAVEWRDLLRNIPAEGTKLATSAPPGGSLLSPSLIFETAPFREGAPGAYRLQVWFDSAQSFAVNALVASTPAPSGDGGWLHQPTLFASWSDPITVAGGVPFHRKCLFRHFEFALAPVEGRPEAEWPQQPFEALQVDYTFENIAVNEPVDVALFDITPAPGTNVTDEQKGFTFVLGKAGEELEKTATAERDRRPAPVAYSPGRFTWRTIFIASNLIALVALIAYRLIARRQNRSRL